MMNRGFLLFVALAFAAGFWARGFWGLSSKSEGEIPVLTEASDHGELQKLVDVDVAEYYRLKDAEAKYQKADELLAKMVLIFLSDLGVRVHPETAASAKKALANPIETGTPDGPSGAVVSNQPPPAPTPTKNAGSSSSDARSATPSPVATSAAVEKSLSEVRNEADISDFLNKTKYSSPDTLDKLSASFTNQHGNMNSFVGSFAGAALVTVSDSGATENWWVETTLRGRMRDGAPQGKQTVKISKNGKIFSNSSDSGELDSLRELPGSNAMIIAASPNIYFQLYHLTATDQVIGHLYRRDSRSKPLKHIGTMTLSRVR